MSASVLLPMTRATGLGPLPAMLEQRESARALLRVFQSEGIPLSVVDNTKMQMPVASMIGLFDRSARAVGDRTFGLKVGETMRFEGYGLWLEYSAAAKSLGGALLRTVRTAHFQQSGGTLALEREGRHAVWRYYAPRVSESPIQHSDHVLGPMTRFVARFLGSDWQPSWVELNYPRDALAGQLEDRIKTPVYFGRSAVGIAMDASLLKTTRPLVPANDRTRPVTFPELEAEAGAAFQIESVRSVFSIISLRLLEGQADIDGAARVAGLGVQTLQRMLRQQGLSYRQVLDAARSARARALLRETSQTVTEIALDLGYSDHANFTRAFNRWVGCSPHDFRKFDVLAATRPTT